VSGLRLKLSGGKNILLVGDLRLHILSGCVEVFGAKFCASQEVEVGKMMSAPLISLGDVEIEVEFGEEGYISESSIDLIPSEWIDAADRIAGLSRGSVVLVCADVDSGKSGLVCFIANRAIQAGRKVAIVGADTGQSETNPPTTIGLAYVDRPITHLSQLRYSKAFFVGSTSPSGMLERSIAGVIAMVEEARREADITLVNTTGWVHTQGGRELKEVKLVALRPNFVVILEKRPGELAYLSRIANATGIPHVVVPAAPRLRRRTREERRRLRSNYYAREFQGAKEEVFLVDDLAFMFSYFGTGVPLDAEEVLKVVNTLGFLPEYAEKTQDMVIIVTERSVGEDKTSLLSQRLGTPVRLLRPASFENVLVGLLDENFSLVGLGIIKRFDPSSRSLTIYTRADPKKVKVLAFSRIRLSTKFEEIGWLDPWCF